MSEQVMACPQCSRPGKFSYNTDKQVGHCWHSECNYTMRGPLGGTVVYTPSVPVDYTEPRYRTKAYVQSAHRALLDNRKAYHYLWVERGLKPETINQYSLGYESGKNAIVIPHFNLDGQVKGIKFRHMDVTKDTEDEHHHRYTAAPGSSMQIYNLPGLITSPIPWCIITEGELDAISIFQFESRIPTVAIPGINNFKDRWYKYFERFERIYIAFDNDEESNERAVERAEKLKAYRCYRIQLPDKIHDINDLVTSVPDQHNLVNIWHYLIAHAKCIGRPLIKEIKEYEQEFIDYCTQKVVPRVSTGHPSLDSAMGGLQPGRVYLLKGATGLGKTTFLLDILVNVCKQGHKALVGSFEMKVAEELYPKILGKLLGRDLAPTLPWTPDQGQSALQYIQDTIPMSFLDYHDRLKLGELYDGIKIKYQQGYRYVLLDHAQFIMNLGSNKEGAVFTEHAKVGKFLKRLTNDFPEVCIIVVGELNSQGEAMGGTTLAKVFDVVLSYYGNGLMVEKHRPDGRYKDRKVQIKFDPEHCRYHVW